VTISRRKGYGVGYPIDSGVVAAEPWLSNDQVPSSKFCDLEGEFFHMLVNGKFQVICMRDLSYNRMSSISKDQVFRFSFGDQRQVQVQGEIKIDKLEASS